jgi:hypothetical protein
MASMIDMESGGTSEVYRRADELPFQELSHETVVVNPSTREVHVLNGTASRMWGLLMQEISLPEMVSTLTAGAAFDVEVAVISRDVSAFLADLVQKGIVRVVVRR